MAYKSNFSQKVNQIQRRVENGQLSQYFNKLSQEDARQLSGALLSDDFGRIGTILVKSLSSYGHALEPMIRSSYDEQMKQLAENLLSEVQDDLEEEVEQAIEESDIEELEKIYKELEEEVPPELSKRSERILNKINNLLIKANIPKVFRSRVRTLSIRKKLAINETTKARTYYRWSNRKPAFVLFNRGKIASWQPITRKEYSEYKKQIKKPELQYSSTRRIRQTENIQLVSRKGQPFSNKEDLFIKSRIDKNTADIYNDYLNKFGKSRNKSDILTRIRKSK